MSDTIVLTIPHARPYHGVARLVVGGLAARLDLPLEALEDLQLAVEGVLSNRSYAAGDEVTLEVTVRGDALYLALGPFDQGRIGAELERDPAETDGVGLGRLLSTVMGGYELDPRDGRGWVRLHKELPERRMGVETET